MGVLSELAGFLGILIFWWALQVWILPRFGVPT